MSPVAYVVHELPKRTRVKVPSQRGNAGYFDRTRGRLEACPGVTQIKTNFRTGSLLLTHTVPFARIATFAGEQALFTLLEDPEPDTLLQQASESFSRLNGQIVRFSQGDLDVRSILLITVLVMGVIQVARGRIMMPATALFLNALNLMMGNEAAPQKSDHGP